MIYGRISEDNCPDCGARVMGGRQGCQELYDVMAARAYSDLRYAAVHNLGFDTYCMQHVDTYCLSAKSYAAHLTRLCCGLEYGGNPKIYAAIQKWLNGTVPIAKPVILANLGEMTIANMSAAPTTEEHLKLVQAWAENVWAAYSAQHEIARAWIREALGMEKTP